MTAFGLLWKFLKTEDPTLRQDDFADEIGLQGINGDRTIRNWIKTGFSPAKVTPYEIYKEVFVTNNKFEMLMAKHFLAYIEENGYEIPFGLGVDLDTKEFEHFFSVFLMSDKAKNKKAAAPVVQLPKFSMPAHFRERREELDQLFKNAFLSPDYRVHAIVGERGLGKTTLALNFANEAAKEKRFVHIFNISYKKTVKETVANLEIDKSDIKDTDKRFENNLNLLRDLRKSGEVLLIIDNYDNPDLKDELAEDGSDYVRLLETGCKILITSTSDLGKCHAIEDHVTYLSRFETDTLTDIFFEVKGRRDDDEGDVRALIEDYIIRNTYLVVLSAELARQGMSAREISDAISTLHADDTGDITVNKDGKRQDEKTLFEHYCCVLENNKIVNPDDMRERKEIHGVLGVLALLPIGGVSSSEFEEFAYPYSRRKVFKKALARLKNHNLLFENAGRIYLQPVVREYIVREILLFGEDTYSYLLALINKLDADTYDAVMMHWIKISEAAYQVLGDERIKDSARVRTFEIDEDGGIDTVDKVIGSSTVLLSKIAACYSAVNMYQKAYEYGILALPGLKDICHSQTQPFDNLTLARCFNVVGYAFLYGDSRFHDRNMRTAFECIKKCEELAKRVLDDEENAVKARIVLSKLNGELAAYYIKNKDYNKALEYHTRALHERERLLESDPYSEQYRKMLAFTYRGIGTDYFYLGNADNLKLSYEHHLKSVEIFEELYGRARLETVTSVNRLIGATLALMKCVGDDMLPELTGHTFAELTEKIYKYLSDSFDFYSDGDPSANREMEISLEKVIELTEMMIARGMFDEVKAAFNRRAIEVAGGMDQFSAFCAKCCETLENLTESAV